MTFLNILGYIFWLGTAAILITKVRKSGIIAGPILSILPDWWPRNVADCRCCTRWRARWHCQPIRERDAVTTGYAAARGLAQRRD